MKEKQYDERDAFKLDIVGGYYGRHVQAMTREKLHSKSDIAAELAHRDMIIDELLEALQEILQIGDIYCSSIERKHPLHDFESWKMKARAAINKALGETK